MYGLTSHHDKDCHHHHLPDWAWHTRGLPPSPVQASFPFSVPAHTFNGFSSFLSLYIDKCFVALSLPKFRYDHVGCALFSSCFSFYTDLSLRELESVSNSRLFLVERALQCCVALRGGNQRDVNLLFIVLFKSLFTFSMVAIDISILSYNLVLDELEWSRELILPPSSSPASKRTLMIMMLRL